MLTSGPFLLFLLPLLDTTDKEHKLSACYPEEKNTALMFSKNLC
jgi:hypothetical protein